MLTSYLFSLDDFHVVTLIFMWYNLLERIQNGNQESRMTRQSLVALPCLSKNRKRSLNPSIACQRGFCLEL